MKFGIILTKYKKIINRKIEVIIIYFFLSSFVCISGLLDKSFLTLGNFGNLFTNFLPLFFVATGQTLVILAGGIDLSVGATVCLSNVICATLMTNNHFGFLLGLIVALLVGLTVGFINGLIVTKGKQQPLIVTLAMQTIVAGSALAILPIPGGKTNIAFAQFLTGNIVGIFSSFIITFIILSTFWFLLNKTSFGRFIYATGGNENSAYSSGINTDRIKIITYCLSGFLSSMSGIYLNTIIYSGDPIIGLNYTMESITVVVIGGTSLAGGHGGIIGTFAGALILYIINNILNLLGISSFFQYVLQGTILITALALSSIKSRRGINP